MLLGEGRGSRTLAWFLLPIIFLPGGYVVYSGLASQSGTALSAFVSGGAPQLFTHAFSVSALLWIAWIPVLVYSAFARDPTRSKVGWVLRRVATALVLFTAFVALAATIWYAFGRPVSGVSPPEWETVTLNALFLVGVSSLIAFLSFFASIIGGTILSLPILITSFAIPALVGTPLVRAHAVARGAPPRVGSDHARLEVTVRLHGSKGHKDVEMIVDTGATDTSISASLASELGISAVLGSGRATLADGSIMKVGRGKAIIEYGTWKARVIVDISPVSEPLLGITTLKALGLKVDPVGNRLEPS